MHTLQTIGSILVMIVVFSGMGSSSFSSDTSEDDDWDASEFNKEGMNYKD